LGDYPSFDADSVGEALVIPKSTFEDLLAVHSPLLLLLLEMIGLFTLRGRRKARGS